MVAWAQHLNGKFPPQSVIRSGRVIGEEQRLIGSTRIASSPISEDFQLTARAAVAERMWY